MPLFRVAAFRIALIDPFCLSFVEPRMYRDYSTFRRSLPLPIYSFSLICIAFVYCVHVSDVQEPHIVIVTYDLLARNPLDFVMENYCWDYVVLDEGHKIKNASTQLHKGCSRVCRDERTHRLLLTGTPIQNNLKGTKVELASMVPLLTVLVQTIRSLLSIKSSTITHIFLFVGNQLLRLLYSI